MLYVILKYFHDTLTKEIHHYVECKEDTVFVEKLVPIKQAIFRELSWWDKYREFIYIGLVLLGVYMIIKKIGKII